MYKPPKSRPAEQNFHQHHPNLRISRTAQVPKYPSELHVLQSTRCYGESLGSEHNAQSPCYLHLLAPKAGQKVECPSEMRDFTAKKVERMNERVRDLRRLLEADSRNISARAARKSGAMPEERASAYVGESSNLDIALSYETDSDFDTFSSYSVGLGAFDGTSPGAGIERQTTDLCGVGQWADELRGGSWGPWQGSTTSMDVAQDACLDLASVHAIATTSPFEQYFRARRDEEGALDFRMYSMLP